MRRAAAALLILAACAAGPHEAADSAVDTAFPGATWDSFGRDFFADWCWSCHQEDNPNVETYDLPEEITFATEADVLAWQRPILAALETGSMPSGGGLSDEERQQAIEYVASLGER